MAVNGFTNIVTDGLVLSLDAGNLKSYPTSGTTWTDLSRIVGNGTLVGGVSFNTGNTGNLQFNGSGQYITANPTVFPSKTNFTLNSFWRFNKSKANALFSSTGSGAFTNDVLFAYDPNLAGGALFFQINNGADGSAYTTRSYTSLSWINICVVFDGSQATNQGKLKVYIDGVLENLTYGYTVPSSTSGTNWPSYFGIYAASSGWDLLGNISFVHFYNRSLSASEVLQNYNATKWRFI